MIDPKKVGGVGASEVSALFTKDGIRSKSAHTLAYNKALEILTGERKEISTKAMEHGIINESEAFENCVMFNIPEANLQSTESYFIKDGLWATPDVVTHESVIDIKCPYTPYSYFQNISKLKKSYIIQVNTQMTAMNVDKGALLFYLTSDNYDKYGNKIELNIPLHNRFSFVNIEKQDNFLSELLKRFDEFQELRDIILKDISSARVVDDLYFYDISQKKKITRFRDKSNLRMWGGKILKYNNEFYTFE